MVHIEVFKICLKQLGRWDPEITPEKEVDQMIPAAKTRTTSWKGELYSCKGTFVLPVAVDGVWIYQPAVVTLDQRHKGDFVLGEHIPDSACLRRAVDWYGRVVLGAHSATDVNLQFGEESIITRALLDTGAAPNVMPEQLYEELDCGPLLEASPQLYSADKSAIKVLGRTAPTQPQVD